MFGMGWGELMVLAVVGLFVLGPERLPAAIRWATSMIAHAKSYAAAAKEHLDSPEFAELRKPLEELREPLAELRAADPRRALRATLFDTLTSTEPAGSSRTGSPATTDARDPEGPDRHEDPQRDARAQVADEGGVTGTARADEELPATGGGAATPAAAGPRRGSR